MTVKCRCAVNEPSLMIHFSCSISGGKRACEPPGSLWSPPPMDTCYIEHKAAVTQREVNPGDSQETPAIITSWIGRGPLE
ncbi:hypothetical protein EVAR_97984_1, partial [Eumeta japonica]